MSLIDDIRALALRYSEELKVKIANRVEEMEQDDTSYYLIYAVLGISDKEGKLAPFPRTGLIRIVIS